MTGILVVQTRIIDLCKLIDLPAPLLATKAVKNETDCSFTPTDLPVFVIKRGPGIRHSYQDTSSRLTVREYLLKLFVVELCDTTNADGNETEMALAASCIEPVLDFFTPRSGLSLVIDGEPLVNQAQIVQDSGDTYRFTRSNGAFAGALFRMQVVTGHHAGGDTLW